MSALLEVCCHQHSCHIPVCHLLYSYLSAVVWLTCRGPMCWHENSSLKPVWHVVQPQDKRGSAFAWAPAAAGAALHVQSGPAEDSREANGVLPRAEGAGETDHAAFLERQAQASVPEHGAGTAFPPGLQQDAAEAGAQTRAASELPASALLKGPPASDGWPGEQGPEHSWPGMQPMREGQGWPREQHAVDGGWMQGQDPPAQRATEGRWMQEQGRYAERSELRQPQQAEERVWPALQHAVGGGRMHEQAPDAEHTKAAGKQPQAQQDGVWHSQQRASSGAWMHDRGTGAQHSGAAAEDAVVSRGPDAVMPELQPWSAGRIMQVKHHDM